MWSGLLFLASPAITVCLVIVAVGMWATLSELRAFVPHSANRSASKSTRVLT
jgi:hypothetical protein